MWKLLERCKRVENQRFPSLGDIEQTLSSGWRALNLFFSISRAGFIEVGIHIYGYFLEDG